MNHKEIYNTSRWETYIPSYNLLINHINDKDLGNKYKLDIVDLFYVRNFKGGSATIKEDKKTAEEKLLKYSKILKEISDKYQQRDLHDLSKDEMEELKDIGYSFVKLSKNEDTRINGFGPSFSSALLHGYFPKLLPILDRRVINGSGIEKIKINQQVNNLESYYKRLVELFWERVSVSKETIREVDRVWFSVELNKQ